MNISTGGPHILLFERDQQLAALLISEFQLAGYECHTARTAVEVFDAIARHPIRIVLVNLAQAAAARREFWVALDTQRRGRGVQVLTFQCTNLAGYGPRDPDERSQSAIADMEIDGMLGVMSLIDAVRARVPGAGSTTASASASAPSRFSRSSVPQPSGPAVPSASPAPTMSSNSTTMPAMSPFIASAPPPPVASSPTITPRQGSQPSMSAAISAAGTSLRSSPPSPSFDNVGSQYTPRNGAAPIAQPPANVVPAPQAAPPPPQPVTEPANIHQPQATFTEKIRAVLYPNQRTWTPQGGSPSSPAPSPVQEHRPVQENKVSYETPDAAPLNHASFEAASSVLQRLADGQPMDGQRESGLAQLSRMVQERFTPPPALESPDAGNSSTMGNGNLSTEMPSLYSTGISMPPPAPPVEQAYTANTETVHYAPPAIPRPVQGEERISTQPLRASPIQDMPVERPPAGQPGGEGARRPDVLSRANYGQQSPSSSLPPLTAAAPSPQITREERSEEIAQQRPPARSTEEQDKKNRQDKENPAPVEPFQAEKPEMQNQDVELDESTSPHNAMLLDIMQSLPPMPALSPSQQAMQPQVLSGRATRSLGSVLLEGHLVPQSRLEVAQHIQRMLRGVDLNYQLGEILLMFKLLTPDQLLAASLVSYGLITTTQISALGRIRQELHSIGLEYDLESLLILFRILTPEQLREVKATWQG